ncbi:T9SS sorting signal type C domain-containing protein [Flavobacterium sp. DGU38]|uniref:T9SS sorting signal type C domain-containing protein n=1 Tax=Flavobacterium calami TaxID=3139144 RepID=A0ABU9ITB1_9FLAO
MRLKLFFLSFFVYSSIWAQPPHTFTTLGNGTFKVPAGVTSLNVECWGAGGAGGGISNLLYGGGGGGGGAYSRAATFGVTPATTLNYKVGAGGAGVSGLDGQNGEATFFSTVTANGGTGGKSGALANGLGGAGGTVSGVGSFAGGNGLAGGTVGALVPVLASGGGGGSAGPGPSGNGVSGNNASVTLLVIAGGAAVTGGGKGGDGMTLSLGGTVNAGNAPGGGGGGALALLASNSYPGGNGGNGQIKVNYTCPTYGFTGISAPDVCIGSGTTSLVKLTGVNLPVGDYVVNYNTNNPSATLTANATVSIAGTLEFTATGLNSPGQCIITVTRLTSEACFNNISTGNAVTINVYSANTGGTVDTPAAICSGSTSGLLTLSGHTGSIVKWQYAVSPFSTWTDIPTATTATYTSGVLTQTTHFRAVVKNGVCNETYSTSSIVTVNPLPTITMSGTLTDICFSANAQTAVLPYSATTNTPINYSIVWDTAANNAGLTNQGVTSFTFSSGGGSLNTIVIPAGVTAGTYTGTLTLRNANNCISAYSIQLTIKPMPTAPVPGTVTEPTCVLATGGVTLGGLPAAVTWTIRQIGTASTTYTGTGTTYPISGLDVGTYQFTVEYTGSCTSALSSNVVVNPLVTNTYNSGGWSNGTPTINQNLVFASAHISAGGGLGDLSGCNCTINSGINVVISSFDTLTINNSVTNNGGTLIFENHASLLQIANATNSGNIIFKRISSPMKNFDFTYWASPVSGQTLYNLSPNTLADKYLSYTGTAWKIENPVSTIMKPGTGYIIRTPKEGEWPNGEDVEFPYSQKVQFIGLPNNGNIPGETVTAGNYYLVGNPYPSALDADKFLFANPNPNNSAILDGTIYFWTHNTAISQSGSKYIYNSNDYASYNGVGGIATLPSATGGALPNGKIASGQSFFALAIGNGPIVFNNGMRVSRNNDQFFKSGKTSKIQSLEKHRVWLNMTNTGGAFKQLLIGYVEGATNGFDRDFDGLSFDGNAFIDFYSIGTQSNLVIQGRALPFNDSDVVSIGYRTVIAGDFTISIDHADGLLGLQSVFLEDKLTNTLHDLTQGNYTFNTTTGVFNNRFVLRYTNKTLNTANFEKSDNDVAVWVENKSIKLRSEKENINKVFVYDLSGKLVYNDTGILTSEVTISNLKFKNEVLLVKVVLANNNILTKKIVTGFK